MTARIFQDIFNQPETAHGESPINRQGAERVDDNSRELIHLWSSSKVEAGKAHISWSARDSETDVVSEKEDIVRIDQVLDYIEQEILFESEFDIDVTLSSKKSESA